VGGGGGGLRGGELAPGAEGREALVGAVDRSHAGAGVRLHPNKCVVLCGDGGFGRPRVPAAQVNP